MMHARRLVMARIAWRNVLRNWRHSHATVVAIVSGFTAVALFDGYLADLRGQVRDIAIHRGMLARRDPEAGALRPTCWRTPGNTR